MEYIVKRFKQLLWLENQRQNLISRRSTEQDLDRHIEDAARGLRYHDLQNQNIIDIGTGAGFPGLVLGILQPDSQVTLLESDLKKTGFLQTTIDNLNLKNIRIIRDRAEVIGQDLEYREKFDLATSRAVAAMNIILEYGLPLLKIGGTLLLWKGKRYEEEIELSGNALHILGGKVVKISPYVLDDGVERVIISILKERKTPDKYPRRPGVPQKKPL
jgi:16S rRNA (guanine527-N7)-methyltransferase